MISGNEIKVIDRNSEYFGVPSSQLMEHAGKGIAKFIQNRFKSQKILILCGTGNNGGDGFVAARYLSKKFNVTIYLTGKENEIKTTISQDNFKKLKSLNINIYNLENQNILDKLLEENGIILDAMLGIGLSGNLREPYSFIVTKINSKKINL